MKKYLALIAILIINFRVSYSQDTTFINSKFLNKILEDTCFYWKNKQSMVVELDNMSDSVISKEKDMKRFNRFDWF